MPKGQINRSWWEFPILPSTMLHTLTEVTSTHLGANLALTEFRHMAHFWMSYGRCTMPGSHMGRSEGLPRRWTGQVLP